MLKEFSEGGCEKGKDAAEQVFDAMNIQLLLAGPDTV